MKDWGISRQRYWGCPIPMIYLEDGTVVPVQKDELPVTLPEDVDLKSTGNPLENHPSWKKTIHKKTGKPAVRETDTLDTFVILRYFLRFCSLIKKILLKMRRQIIGCQWISILEVLNTQFCICSILVFCKSH